MSELCRVERATREGWCAPSLGGFGEGSSLGPRILEQPEERTGVEEVACRDGWSVNWGDPPAPVAQSIRRGSGSRYKRTAKSGAGAEGVGAGRSTADRRDNTTRRREGPALR